ncbi:collagen binding domain-containing protein [Micromonospora sp. NPDC050397]|uniref:MSCRAMM family protein n=1 Tax=Micromonospora sp. NPDC050397 TaxID=3364279 RepID=UPI00384B4F28
MSRSHLRGLGTVVVAALVATLSVGAPAQAAVATGTIAGTITGNGAPASDVTVYVSSADGSFNDATTTNASGQYELTGVPVAESAYRLTVEPRGGPRQYIPGKIDEEAATLFSVAADGRTVADDSLLPTGTITGRFTDPAGNGVSAWVSARPFDGNGVEVGLNTDVNGAYTLNAWPGTYRVEFFFGNGRQWAYGAATEDRATPIQVAVGQTATVNDVRIGTGTITGKLTRADGSPAAGFRVGAESNENFGYATTDDSGAYQLTDLVPGGYRVYFEQSSGVRQWAPQSHGRDDARVYDVTAGSSTTIDERFLPTGSIAGRFTDQAGHGMGDVQVQLSGTDDFVTAYTSADGDYRIDGIFPGSYQVSFYHWQTNLSQYAYGKLTQEAADPITVTADQTTTVNDSRLPTGTVRVTAKDSVTGAPISRFSASIGNTSGEATSGSAILSDVPIGTHTVSAYAAGYRYEDRAATVTVVAGEQSEVQLTLSRLATITTKVTDRATGAPVAGMCVFARPVKTFSLPDGCGDLTDSTGAISLRVSDPGTYNLFVLPKGNSPYGAQWVGLDGGTGDQGAARRVTVEAGASKSVPTIKLDPRGVVTGKVTGTDGLPARDGSVGIVGPDVGAGVDTRYSPVAADGTYRIDWLGPYQWPLQFEAADHAIQWSGGVGNRLNAQLVPVGVGTPTVFDYQLKQGATMTITVPGASGWDRAVIRNSVTRDPIAVVDSQTFAAGVQIPVIGSQKVKIEFSGRWYGGTDFASATLVTVPRSGNVQIVYPAS